MKTPLRFLPVILVLAAFPAAAADGAKAKPAAKPPVVLAKAGEISVNDQELAAYAMRESRKNLADLDINQRRSLLTKLVVRKALAAKAVKAGLDRDPGFEKALLQWKLQAYPNLYWTRLVDPEVKITDAELREFVKPQPEYRIAAINFGFEDGALAVANEVHQKLVQGTDFVELVRDHSVGLAAPAGGEMGWQNLPSKFVEESEAAVLRRTKVGDVTKPLQTRAGVVIFKLVEFRSVDEVFARDRQGAVGELRPRRVQEAHQQRLAELRAKSSITYPALQPGAPAGAPSAVIDGMAFTMDTGEKREHGSFVKNVQTPDQKIISLVDAFLVVKDAERRKLDQDPELRQGLELERMEVLVTLLLRNETAGGKGISEEDMRAEYRRFYVPEIYELLVIIVPTRDLGDKALRKVKEGGDFSALAKEFGTGRTASTGGKLAPGPIVDYPAPVRAAIAATADGGTTGVLNLGEGQFAIFKRLRMQTITVPPFESVSTTIRARLAVRQRATILEDFVENFRKGLKITINEEPLRKL